MIAYTMDVAHVIAKLLIEGKITSRAELQQKKIEMARRYKARRLPSNAEILTFVPEDQKRKMLDILKLKPTRTLSGVAPIAVMTSPAECPHGRCLYCPGGVERGTAQSYTGREPAALRAEAHKFDPYEQVKSRIEQLDAIGHCTDKIDLIIMGGTFTARDRTYQKWFVQRCFDAMNSMPSKSIEEAHKMNENAAHRCIGLTVETRPDWFREEHVQNALFLGATRVELGVQTLFDDVLEKVERGHKVQDTIEATKEAKNAGLKVCYHIMPGLPGSTPERDIEVFRRLFECEEFRPDMLKIYPTVVVEGTKLYEMWRQGEYEPYDLDTVVRIVAEAKHIIPPYVRVQRIQRDIPAPLIDAGVKKGNLRQIVRGYMKEHGMKCRCIRCREVARVKGKIGHVEMRYHEYRASGGREMFLSLEAEDGDAIIGYARLRSAEASQYAYVREVKVFGEVVPIGDKGGRRWQHRGFGRQLMSECEELAREWGYEGVRVTSGVGVREYYRALGYSLEGPYMVKNIKNT